MADYNNSLPTIQRLLEELKDVDNWFVFGVHLGVPVKQLQKIESAHRGELERCKIDMLQYWLDNDVNASWKDVVRALEQTNQLVLAETVKQRYLLSDTADQGSIEQGEANASLSALPLTPLPPPPPPPPPAVATTTSTTTTTETEIKASIAVVKKLQGLENSYSHTLVEVVRFLKTNCDLSEAQLFLDVATGTEEFSRCDNFDKLIRQLQRDQIDVFNISRLQELVACFKKSELTELVELYDKKKNSFLESTTVNDFQCAVVNRVKPDLHVGEVTVTIKIPKKMASHRTLKDIEELAMEGFEECYKSLIRLHAEAGSIIISWIFPEALSDKLEQLACKNAVIFKAAGVEEVTVGGRRVYPVTQQEDITTLTQDMSDRVKSTVYTDFYHQPIDAVSDPLTCQSLAAQLHSTTLISQEKIAQLSSGQTSGSKFLKVLDVEEEPHLLTVLKEKMVGVKQLHTMAGQMTAELQQGTIQTPPMYNAELVCGYATWPVYATGHDGELVYSIYTSPVVYVDPVCDTSDPVYDTSPEVCALAISPVSVDPVCDASSEPPAVYDTSPGIQLHTDISSSTKQLTHMYHQSSHHSSAPGHSTHMYHQPHSFRTLRDFEFDKTGLKCHLSDHGITVIIPENAINENEAILRVGVYFVDSFQFPEGYRLVSEVFWIDSNILLHKNVDFYMPHFVKLKNKNDTKKLKFFLASDESFRNYGVFKFTDAAANHQYSFEPDVCYGKLVLNHFCSGCILEKIDHSRLPLEYLVTSVLPTNCDRPSWTAEFVFSYALPICQKVVISQYPQSDYNIYCCYKVTFLNKSSAKLVYIFKPDSGWMIDQKIVGKQISERDIDYRMQLEDSKEFKCSSDHDKFWRDDAHKLLTRWEDMKQYPPRLSLGIVRTQQAQEPLRTDVTVNGVEPELKIRMIAPPYSGTNNCGSRQATPTQAVTEMTETHASFEEERGFLANAVLLLQDHLVREWFTFGLHLGLEVEELNILESSYLCQLDQQVCVRQMLTKWKNKFDRNATWDRIVYALKKIGNNSLARKVEERYMQSPKPTLEEEDIV